MWIINDISLYAGCDYYSAFKEKLIINLKNKCIDNYYKDHICVINPELCPKLDDLEMIEVDIVIKGDTTILSNYTDKQLKAELYKRKLARRG